MLLAVAALVSCRAGEAEAEPPEAEPVVVGPAVLRGPRSELPSLLALQAAVQDGEDALAAELIRGIRGRTNDADALAALDSFERILRGRALVRGLELSLGIEPDEEVGQHWLVLSVTNGNAEDIVLHLPPASVERRRSVIGPDGSGGRHLKTRRADAFSGLELSAGESTQVVLFLARAPIGNALAVQELWRLAPLSGRIVAGGESYPAAQVTVASIETTLISPALPQDVVRAEAFVAYIERADVQTAEAIRRAVRVPLSERDELFAALAPVVQLLALDDPERVRTIAPALAWLTQAEASSRSPQEWVRVLRQLTGHRASAERDRLDLPFPQARE